MGSAADALIDSLLPKAEPESPRRPDTPATPAPTRSMATPTRSAGPAPITTAADPMPVADPVMRVDRLLLREVERDFVKRLRPLLDTPRTVKKLINVYRLVRIGIPADRLGRFVGDDGSGPYQAVLVLLAITLTTPDRARALLTALRRADQDQDVWTVFAALEQDDDGWRAITGTLTEIRAAVPVHGDVVTYRSWSGTVARFSFDTYDMVDSDDPSIGE
jgi:hypothetical protein